MSRTALDGFPLGNVEKNDLLNTIRQFSKLYFVDKLGFCLMGNHFHLLIRMYPDSLFDDKAILDRLNAFYKSNKNIVSEELLKYRNKLSSLSNFVKDIKQGFTRKFNKENMRRGFFWRFQTHQNRLF
jgi:putative transposase